MKKLFIFTLALFSLTVQAQDVPKQQWIKSMNQMLPAMFCSEPQYFRQCFNVDVNLCKQVATQVTKDCFNKLGSKIPDPIKGMQDGAKWGQEIGVCAGMGYEKALHNKRLSNSRCNNPQNWM